KARELRPGDAIRFACKTWKTGRGYDDGWLSGIYDGEGWVSSTMCGVAQNEGRVLDRIEKLLVERGGKTQRRANEKCVQLVATRMWEAMRVLGILRPVRLMPLANQLWEGRRGFMARGAASNQAEDSGRHVARVLRVEEVESGPVVALTTSTGTL